MVVRRLIIGMAVITRWFGIRDLHFLKAIFREEKPLGRCNLNQ